MTRLRLAGARVLLPLLLLIGSPAAAEVVEAAEGGFVVEVTARVPVAPGEAWAALIAPAEWWDADHTWSGDASNLSLEPAAGGCFCEVLPRGGSVEHMRVIYSAPEQLLRMAGALGPLQSEALAGALTIELAPEGDDTRIEWTYVVGGHARLRLAEVATAVDAVLASQLGRLEALLVRGESERGGF